MYRYLFKLGPITLYSYGAMLAVAFIAGALLSSRRAKQYGIDADRVLDLIFVILIASLIGARFLFVTLNWSYFDVHRWEIFKLWEGGLVFYGGLIAGFLAVLMFLKIYKLSFGKVADVLAPPLALGMAIGRIGCFLNGCCWGKISFRWGVCFPARDNPPVFAQQVYERLIAPTSARTFPVLPTQLYESVLCLAIFFTLLVFERRKRFDGFLFWLFIMLYAGARFIVEAERYYEPNFIFGIFTVSQLVSIALFFLAVAALIIGLKTSRHPQ